MKIGTYETHEACDLFPLLGEEELCELTEDIKKNGLRHSISLHQGQVLDGRNRLLACERAGVQPRFKTVSPKNPVAYVVSENLIRRHLKVGEKAAVGVQVKAMSKEQTKRKQQEGGRVKGAGSRKLPAPGPEAHDDRHDREARAMAAEAVGVSARTIDRAEKVIQKGAPELVAAMKSGDVPVTTAAMIADLPIETQKAIVAGEEPAPKPTKPRKPKESPPAVPPPKIPDEPPADDWVGGLMTRLYVGWQKLNSERRRTLIQVLTIFIQTYGKEEIQ